MMGNFSSSHYFKERAIRSVWDGIRDWIPQDRLMVTVYIDDDEAL